MKSIKWNERHVPLVRISTEALLILLGEAERILPSLRLGRAGSRRRCGLSKSAAERGPLKGSIHYVLRNVPILQKNPDRIELVGRSSIKVQRFPSSFRTYYNPKEVRYDTVEDDDLA